MTLPLDPRAGQRLAKLCGMFGSSHVGERASAAAMADKLVRSLGLTWPQIIVANNRASISEQVAFATANLGALNAWEFNFVSSIKDRHRLSERQLNVLKEIIAKIERDCP
jgi:hypothetical protein